MGGVLALAVLVIVGVLLYTSRSYFEVVIFLIVFAVAALLNMGTNFWLGEISSITNSIAVIMQLALGIDAEELISAYTVEVPGYDGELTVRMLTEENGRLYELNDGALNELSYNRDGSRIVFTLENGGSVVLLQAQRGTTLLLPVAAAAATAIGVAAFFVIRKKKAAKNKAK